MAQDDRATEPVTISYATGPRRHPNWNILSTPIGSPPVIISIALAFLSLYAASGPERCFLSSFAAAFGWFCVLGWLGIKLIFRLVFVDWSNTTPPIGRWKLSAVVALLFATIALARSGLPAQIAFRMERPSMEKIALALMQKPDDASTSATVGVYGVCVFRHDGNTVTIEVDTAAFMDKYGFAYCPSGSPHAGGRMTPIGGPWYGWYLHF